RIEAKGLTLVAMDMRRVPRETAAEHYAEHAERPFYGDLLEFITSGPVVAGVVEGPRAIAAWRQLAGGTDPVEKAAPGSIRGDFGLETQFNLVHGSDSEESAAREIALWFPGL
ncbi:MAG: nucleoside-diphosphate kinase, partial [Dietzia cercidiphylli]